MYFYLYYIKMLRSGNVTASSINYDLKKMKEATSKALATFRACDN